VIGEDLEIGDTRPAQGRALDRVARWGISLIMPLALELDRDDGVAERIHHHNVRTLAADPAGSIWIVTRQDLTEADLCKSAVLEPQACLPTLDG
jgi:hypothetical protein